MSTKKFWRWLTPFAVAALALVGLAAASSAEAAVTGTLNQATLDPSATTDFTWTCDINPGGATIYVMGRSWNEPTGGVPGVDTARQAVSGTTTRTVRFSRHGVAGQRYGYRCLWYASATTSTVLGRTSDSFSITTGSAIRFGANVDSSTRVPCTSGATCDPATHTRPETFAEALAREDAAYGPRILRIFNSGLPSTDCRTAKNSQPRTTIQSFKDDPATFSSGSHDATINAWLACFDHQTYVCYYHEPEDNFTTPAQRAAYVAAGRHFATLVKAHPNRANLLITEIYGDYTWDRASGRTWTDWYWGDAYVDVLGADIYNFRETDSSATNNQTMATHQVLRPSLAAAVAHGKPFVVPELGYNDPGTRAAFLAGVGTWADANRATVRAVTYFDSIGTLGDHRLRDAASQTAWRDVVATH